MKTNRITDSILLNDLCKYISSEAKGFYVQEVFSTSKNELIIVLRFKETLFLIEAYMDDETSFVFFPDSANSGRNSKSLFPEINNWQLISAYSNHEDRSFFLEFENKYSLLFKMYGRNANVILFNKNKVVSLFKSQFEKDNSLHKSDFMPAPEANILAKYYIYQSPKGLYLSLESSGDTLLFESSSAIEAVSFYAKEYLYLKLFQDKKQKLIQTFVKKKEKAENGLKSAKIALEHLENDKSYKIQADILMANLNIIPQGATSIELYDFYHDKQIEIKLKRTISPQKWAESLYKKSRNQEIEKDLTLEKIISLEQQIKDIGIIITKIESAKSSRELKPFLKSEEQKEEQSQLPFRQMDILGYDVFIGKNAKSNDEMLRYAHKEDMWLHARGVSGSHVIIKKKGKQVIPKDVIERAASLAAWYSKGKNATLCPVIYTPRKYVRKPKGAAPGAVVCEREEVILVKPEVVKS